MYIMPYTHLSSTVYELYSEILVGNCNFSYHFAFYAPVEGDPLGQSSLFLVDELPDGQATIWCKNIPEKSKLM